jgi:signal peptidase II
MKKKFLPSIISIVTAALLIWLDQWTKALAVRHLKDAPAIELIPGVFELAYVENRGAAFGVMQNQQIFFFIMTVIVLMGVLYLYIRMPFECRYLPLRACFTAFVAGAIGNMIDRLNLGYVVDFFYFRLIDFPVFNVADCYVTVTVILFAILFLFCYKEEELSFIPGMMSKKETEV